MKTQKYRKNNGFTLIELLIVITVIGILITMLIPNLSSAQDKAKEAAVRSVMHALQLAVESYNIDEGTYPAGDKLTTEELYTVLADGKYLKSLPQNPFTRSSYSSADSAGQIYYSYDGSSNTYTLEGYGRNIDKPIMSLTGA